MKKELYVSIRKVLLYLLRRGAFFMSQNNNYILCYHSFSAVGNSYSVLPKTFAEQIKALSQNYTFVGLDQIFNNTNKNCIAITVDDGYEDFLSVMPIIEKYNLPVTLFVLGDPQKANRKELDHKGKLLTFTQIKSLQKKGITIGCHSMTHANFSDLSVKELSFEIKQAKKLLEQKLNTKVNYFAFPKGIYTDESLKIVKKAGFVAAFTVRSGAVKGYSLITPRAIVDKFYSTEEIESLLNPFVIQIKNLMIKFNMWRLVPNL